VDFQQEVSKAFLDFSKCGAVEFWLKDHEKYYRCRASRKAAETPKIQFLPPVRSLPFPFEAGRNSYLLDTSKNLSSHPRLLIPLVVETGRLGCWSSEAAEGVFHGQQGRAYETLGKPEWQWPIVTPCRSARA
jgi:hypothetical protein